MKNFCECESANCDHPQSCQRIGELREVHVDGQTQTLCRHCRMTAATYLEEMHRPPISYAEEFWVELPPETPVRELTPGKLFQVTFPCFVSVRLHDKSYGGPEEGGWWYDTWERVTSHQANSQEALDRITRHLQRRYNNAGRPSLSSVSSRGRFELFISKEIPPNTEPEVRPHYE